MLSVFSEEDQDIIISEQVHSNGTLSVTCTVHHQPSQVRSMRIAGQYGSSIAGIEPTNRIHNYQSDGVPDVFGRLDSNDSPSFLSVHLKTKCHRSQYTCHVRLGHTEWRQVKKEVETCGKRHALS